MDNNLDYSIRIIPEGVSEIAKLPAIIDGVGNAVERVNSTTNPLQQIISILTNIQTLLFAVGNVGVESFNKLDQILITNQEGFRKGAENADKLEKEIDDIGKASKKAGREVKTGLLENLAGLGQAFVGIKAMAQTVIGAIAPIFKEGMARENAVSDFATLLGSKEEAAKYAEELRNTAAAKLYGAGTINDNAKSMLAYGLDADTAKETLSAIGDIAMGDANKMNSLATAFSQMSSLGKLQAQDWKQMVGAGFNPFIQMQKDLGKTAEELDTMMSKGLISADMVKNAFTNAHSATYTDLEGKVHVTTNPAEVEKVRKEFADKGIEAEFKVDKGQFFGALDDTLNNTLSGKLASLTSTFDDLKAKIFELLVPLANKLVPVIEQLIPVISDLAENVLAPVLDFVAEYFDVLLPLAEIIGVIIGLYKLWSGAQTILNAIMSANPISLIIIAIAALIAMVYKAIDAWDTWGAALTLVLGPIGVIVNLVMTLKSHWDSIVEAFNNGGIIGGIKRIGIVLLDCILKPVQQLLEMIAKIPGIGDIAQGLASKVENLRRSLDLITPEEDEARKKAAEGSTETQDSLTGAVNSLTTKGTGTLANAATPKTESVASGGTRSTQITINLDNMVETVNFNGGVEENAQRTTDTFVECLLRALYSAQTAV